MKKSIFITLLVTVVSIGLMGFGADTWAGAAKSATTILTVKEVRVSLRDNGFDIKGLKLIDKKGHAIFFPEDVDEWFENVRVRGIEMPVGTGIYSAKDDSGHFHLVISGNGKLFFEFSANGSTYSIGLGTGTKFVVQKTKAGKYILLPEETVKLSPPPEGK